MANRFGLKLLFILLLVGFGIFYGVDLATRGMETIHGPFEENAANVENPANTVPTETISEKNQQMLQEQAEEPVLPPAPDPVILPPKSPGLAEIIGRGLQEVAQFLVNIIVSLFEWLL